jgi:hypothetical protein
MNTTIVSKGSIVRCYKCGSSQVSSICHHCGRPMCSRHGPVKPLLSWFTENREFKNLSLDKWPFRGDDGVHCEFHVHSTLNFRRIMIYPGVFVAIVGLGLLILAMLSMITCLTHWPTNVVISAIDFSEVLRDPAVYASMDANACYLPQALNNALAVLQAIIVLGFGIGAVVAGTRLNRESADPDLLQLGIALPFGPSTNRIRIVEALTQKIAVEGDGTATSRVLDGIQGEINPSFVFTTQDIQRIEAYRQKYRISPDKDLAFQAGYLLLKGSPYLTPIRDKSEQGRFSPKVNTAYRTGMKNVIKLGGHINDYSFFKEKDSGMNFAWQKSWCYTVKQDDLNYRDSRDNRADSPVWILPVLFEHGETKMLALMVQLNIGYFPGLDRVLKENENVAARKIWIERARLDRIQYSEFGKPKVENAMLMESEDPDEPKVYDIVWHDVLFNPGNDLSRNMVFDGFKVWFDHKFIQDAKLRGSMLLRIPSLVSDIQGIEYYSALGQLTHRNGRELQRELMTNVRVEFEIVPAKTVLSHLAASPCIAIESPGAPTPRRLHHILNCFHSNSADGQIFIYRVVESQPQLGDEDSEAGKWHWQLFGKRYREITPIDFHILIYGYGDQEKNGRTRIETSVIANVDEGTVSQAEETKIIIQDILRDALNAEL